MPENVPVGTLVATVSATDQDQGSFAMIQYSMLSGAYSNHFRLNESTGEISLLDDQVLDREVEDEILLEVQAQDDWGNGNKNVCKVAITLLDANGNGTKVDSLCKWFNFFPMYTPLMYR